MKLLPLLLFLAFSIPVLVQGQQLSEASKVKIHEFDFWIGEWTVYNYGTDSIAGYSHIESILDSMGIQEHYSVPAHRGLYKGTSLNKYNFQKHQWEQLYIDNAGSTLPLEGGIVDGSMILSNIQESPTGPVMNRITWTPMADGTVRQTWHSKSESEEKWNVLFDGHYKKKE